MLCYLTVIGIANILITLANLCVAPELSIDFALRILFSAISGTVTIILLDGAVAFIIRRLTPAKWFSAEKKVFCVTKKERDLYISLAIKRWKDKIPELGGFTGFHKNRLESTSDKKYLERFILEANYGVVIHISNALLGFLIAFLPFCSSAGIWIPIFGVNFVLSLLPVAVLRYTCYTLQRLYARA